jgi:hypothetical protein
VQFRIEQRFAGSIEGVEATLLDPEFIASLAELPKLGRPTLLDRHVEGDVVRQRVRHTFVGELSGAVRAVVDPRRLTWVEVSTTDRATHGGKFEIQPDHYANLLRCQGTSLFSAETPGCQRVTDGELVVSVPLVGRRVETAIVSGLEEHASLEAQAVDGWLSGDRRPRSGH